MSDKIKVVDFGRKPKPTEEDYIARMPNDDDIKALTNGDPLQGVFILFMTKSGIMSHYMDGLSIYQTVGMLEEVKLGLLGASDVADVELGE